MLNFYYKSGMYPTTMQGYLDHYVEEIFDRNKKMFLKRFNLPDDPYKEKIDPSNMTLKYMCNFSAYIIYDANSNHIVDLAFENLFDFVWLLQILNVDGVTFSIPKIVYEDLHKDFKLLSDRLILRKK